MTTYSKIHYQDMGHSKHPNHTVSASMLTAEAQERLISEATAGGYTMYNNNTMYVIPATLDEPGQIVWVAECDYSLPVSTYLALQQLGR